jgi:hypothetical protein
LASDSTGGSDPDALVDALLAEDVLREGDDGRLALTEGFEHRWSVYFDTYASVTPDAFEESVADTFGISPEDARESDVTRAEFSYFLAVRAHADGEYATPDLGQMAAMLVEVGPSSPVPNDLAELTDETYADFLASHDDCVVSVWKRDCAPCEAVADALPEIRSAVPDVAFAGVDGDDVVELRREFAIDAAPAFLCFRDADLCETVTGSVGTDAIIETLRETYA